MKVKKKQIQERIFTENFHKIKTFKELHLHHSTQDKSSGRQLKVLNMLKKGFGHGTVVMENLKKYSGIIPFNKKQATKSGSTSSDNSSLSAHENEPLSPIKVTRKVHGKPKLVKKQMFYKGNAYLIEEEIYSEADKSSVYTSEDDFCDGEAMPSIWCEKFPLPKKNGDEEDFFKDEEYTGDAKTK